MKKQWQCLPVLALWIALTLGAWLLPAQAESDSERRPLAQWPGVTVKQLLNGSFMDQFEDYTLDQFPLRDSFRRIKTLFHTGVMGQQDSNGIYIHDGFAAKMEYPLNEASVRYALGRLNRIYEKYLSESRAFMAVVPDKNYYLAPESDRMALDYEKLFAQVQSGMPWAEHIRLTQTLSLEDYYRTDTHWRQEALLDAAGVLCEAMGIMPPQRDDFTPVRLEKPFYGVYHGQSALPLKPEDLYIMESPVLSQCTVLDVETGRNMEIYDMSKLTSRDLYDVYLGGAKALLVIENPSANTDKELIVFRDSFGSSMIPLLVPGYAKITVVDIRYVGTELLDKFIEFKGQDVLMLYSTLILNSSSAMK